MALFDWLKKIEIEDHEQETVTHFVQQDEPVVEKTLKELAEEAAAEVERAKTALAKAMARSAEAHEAVRSASAAAMEKNRAEAAVLEQELADAIAKADFHSNNSVTIAANIAAGEPEAVAESTATAEPDEISMAQQYQASINEQSPA